MQPDGRHQGKTGLSVELRVVLPNITRAQFDKAELAHAIEPHRVICQDEMGEQMEPEALQSRLWHMFPFMMGGVMSLPQMDRVRWIMFPEVRVRGAGPAGPVGVPAGSGVQPLGRVPAHGRRVVQIPSGQYQAVLIDEGHDFAPEWLRLVVQMVDPTTNSLLVLYDDAQSIYERTQKSKNFSFKSVGIQAQGRTTILKINYPPTRGRFCKPPASWPPTC